jgi:hypothetical protein
VLCGDIVMYADWIEQHKMKITGIVIVFANFIGEREGRAQFL